MVDIEGAETLSRRGRRLLELPPQPEYVYEHFQRRDLAYHAEQRPDGYVPLCIAENKLVTDLVRTAFEAADELPDAAFGYDTMTGALGFREALARFMSKRILHHEFEPEQLAVLSGAGSILETLFHAIADAGDAVLVPTPSYAGFWPDLTTRDELTIIPVHTSSSDGFRLRVEQLDAALANAEQPVRALLFTSPDNPLGRVYSKQEVEAVVAWAERAGVHLVVDEIYALSVFGDRPFVSAASIRPSLGDRLHIVWAFSKDFAMSGARVGVVVTENRAVLGAIEALAYWVACSGPTQYRLARMIADDSWVSSFLGQARTLLEAAYRAVTAALDSARIPYLPSSAGFFLLLDLRRFLDEPTWEGERALWRRFLDEGNVNVTPGAACRIAEPGFMRLCFAAVPTPAVVHGVDALARVLRARH